MMRATLAIALAVVHATGVAAGSALLAGEQDARDRKPKFSVRATPPVSFAPSRVSFTAELRGGSDDYEEFYCPTVEWEWGDGTMSDSTQDCEPYEAGKSAIKRIYTTSHRYEYGGYFTVTVRLKRQKKVLVATTTTVQVRPGIRDGIGP